MCNKSSFTTYTHLMKKKASPKPPTNTLSLTAAIQTFVEGHCVGKSRTHPYEHGKIDGVWFMRDATRKNTRLYRKEEWITLSADPAKVHALAKKHARGRYFICDLIPSGKDTEQPKAQFKSLGYRLLATEPMFIHSLKRIPKIESPVSVVHVADEGLAAKLGKAAGAKPINPAYLKPDSPFRQYAALLDGEPVGWVASIRTTEASWCWNMYVLETHRRKGIGGALLEKMLRDLKKLKFKASVLLSSHTGALLYPKVGYEQVATLYMYAPPRKA
jgi:GNAT superfamily N-acetyltransferase